MFHLSKSTHQTFRLFFAFCSIFLSLFTTISPASAISNFPSPSDLTTARYNIQAVGDYAKYAALASAITSTELDDTNSGVIISAILDIDPLYTFNSPTPTELIAIARNLPFYKEYAYLRTLVNEINYLYNNYEYIANSEEAWKIPYIIDRANNAIEGCNLIFGTHRKPTTTANQATPLADTDPYAAATATIIAEYAAKTDVLRSSNSAQPPRRHSSTSTQSQTSDSSNSQSSATNTSVQATPTNDSTATSTTESTPGATATDQTNDNGHDNHNANSQALVAVAAHTSTAITAAGTLFVVNRRLRKNH